MAEAQLQVGWNDLTLAVNAWKTLASVKAGADTVARLLRAKLGCSGISGDAEPLRFRLQRITADSGTGTATTPGRLTQTNKAAARASCRTNFTAEPTAVAVSAPTHLTAELLQDMFHPQGGTWEELNLLRTEVEGAAEVALQVFVPSGGTAVKCSGHLIYGE